MGQPEGQFPPPGPAAPSTARIYNYLIGGDIHYPADRAAAHRILADFPEFAQLARANHEFVTRAVHYVATQGVIQFVDLGTGLPISPAVHETAWRASPGSYLIASSGTSTGNSPAFIERLRRVCASTSDITGRPAEEIAAWFAGLELVPRGWRRCSCGLLIRVTSRRFPRPGCSERWGGGRTGARPPVAVRQRMPIEALVAVRPGG
jgi:S-adenosyl methyltransferase